MREITLGAMRFHALVGVLPHERELPQPIDVDVTVHVSDDIVLDYRRLYDAAATVIASAPIDYLEEIAERIAAAALALTPAVRGARVAVRKPHVALPGPLAFAEVVVERQAESDDA